MKVMDSLMVSSSFRNKDKPNKDKGEKNKTAEFDGVKPEPKEGEAFNETESVKGYGKPTKGSYNSTEKGYKTFGTEGQGNNTEGVMDKDSKKKSDRGMYVTVTAVADQGTDTILLETGNYDFLEEYEWAMESAMTKVVSLAAIAMVSITMF